ncbi:5-oxoprolinase subunit PxpB [Halobacillus salinus]|uniref:5-oxoprolinase subunit PxpB n=1 Tax=Halobacillus salinus TaxID=192814 RepID=A0A4Z0GUX3_9BACI|nr:5-oxoprolinase subunit PxpB [Halobacillus salinus]TGB01440.1 5-oxoprolinase subunit PxpB [Halobacillus salinus]
MNLSYAPLGDTGMQVVFGNEIAKETNQLIRRMTDQLKDHPVEGVIEWVPAYTTLTLYYDPSVITYQELQDTLQNIYQKVQEQREAASASLVYILPTYYGGEDLSHVAEHNNLTEEKVVQIHSSGDYLIYMMGFVPGFPYLGGMSEEIATPRREDPRPEIAPGSVGIAGSQTGVYPLTSPGGWQLIGRTPVKLYDPDQEKPILLESGHYIRFVPVSKEEYDEIEKAIERGEYTVQTEAKEEVTP